MATLLYYWNFTGADANTSELLNNPNIYDSESNLLAVVKQRGTVTSNSSVSRSLDGIFLNNNDGENGGYYIDLEGLNTIQFGGNLSVEMAVQNHKRDDFKAIYFLSVGENNGVNQAFINCRYNGLQDKDKIFFSVRNDEINSTPGVGVSYSNRVTSEENNSVILDNSEHHYIFSINYDDSSVPSSSSIKIYIDGDMKGDNTADLEKALTTDARSTNFIGTRKVEGTGVTYLKGVVKYLKIYQNSVTDSEATNIYNNFNSSPINFSDVTGESNANIYVRRHTDINLHFSNYPDLLSVSLLGKQLGLSNNSETYKIHKFVSGSTIPITNNYNYIPLETKDNFIILNYDNLYFKITQTSIENGINSKYKCEISSGDTSNFLQQFEDKGYGYEFTYNNVTVILGGVEFNFTQNNPICFHENTIIETDQGKIKIKNLTNKYTIKNCKVISVLKSPEKPNKLVLIKQNAFGQSFPNVDIMVTQYHEIYILNKYIPIYKLINNKTILLINNDNSYVYNIILLNKKTINIANLYLGVIYINQKTYNKLLHYKKKGMKKYILTGYPLHLNKPSNQNRDLPVDLIEI